MVGCSLLASTWGRYANLCLAAVSVVCAASRRFTGAAAAATVFLADSAAGAVPGGSSGFVEWQAATLTRLCVCAVDSGTHAQTRHCERFVLRLSSTIASLLLRLASAAFQTCRHRAVKHKDRVTHQHGGECSPGNAPSELQQSRALPICQPCLHAACQLPIGVST